MPDELSAPTSPVSSEDALIVQARLLSGHMVANIVDGGAYEGDLTARYLDFFPDAHIWAFEPTPVKAEGLRQRFRDEARVTVVEAALGEANTRKMLALNDAPATNSLLAFAPELESYVTTPIKTVGAVEVDVIALDSFCQAHGLTSIDLLKLDVQGAELEVIEGSRALLSRRAIDLFFTEVNFVEAYEGQASVWAVFEALAKHEYRIFDLFWAARSGSGQLLWCDALLTSPKVRDSLAG